jgi:hypothetical protein
MIVLQLKSAHRQADLESISSIIKVVQKTKAYRIKGHEIQQLDSIMRQLTLSERAKAIVDFCSTNDVEYLSYHAPIFLSGQNIWDEKSRGMIKNSISATAEEAEIVFSKAGLRNKIVIIAHLTNFIARKELAGLTVQKQDQMMKSTEEEFTRLYYDELIKNKNCIIAVENTLPVGHGEYEISGPFHPTEIAKLENHNIKTVFDLAHYCIYSNYMKTGEGSVCGDLHRSMFGLPPSWPEAIRILSKSLIQLHINDARGFDGTGEGLPLGEGEIPIRDVLMAVDSLVDRTVRGTLEIRDGHLNNNRLQLEGALWLLDNLPHEIFA